MAIAVDKMLINALLELSKTKSIKKITVQDIMDLTGVSRQTFYNYYRDKFDLINQTWLNIIIGQGQLDENNSLYGYIHKALEKFVQHKKFVIQAEDIQGQDSLIRYMVNHNYNNYRTLFLVNHREEEITDQLEYALYFNAFGVAYKHMQWIKTGMQESIDDMTRWEIECLPGVIKKFLREDGIIK